MAPNSYKADPPVRKIHLIAIGLALLAGSIFLIVVEYASLRSQFVTNLELQMRIVANNTIAALLFRDQVAATETLSTLSASPDVDAVALYGLQQQRFAQYERRGNTPEALNLKD